MRPEQAAEILNKCLELLKIEEQVTLDLVPERGIELSRQAIEYGDILIQRNLYTEACKIGEAGTSMIQYFSEKKIAEIEASKRLEQLRLAATQSHKPRSAPIPPPTAIPIHCHTQWLVVRQQSLWY